MAHNMQKALHKLVLHQPLSVVVTPRQLEGTRQEFHQKVELKQACLEEAGRCFTQVHNMPLLTPPLLIFLENMVTTEKSLMSLQAHLQLCQIATSMQPPSCQH